MEHELHRLAHPLALLVAHPTPPRTVARAAETSPPTTPAVATAGAAPARFAAAAVLRLEHVPGVVALRGVRSEEHTSELQSLAYLVCRLLLEKKKEQTQTPTCS